MNNKPITYDEKENRLVLIPKDAFIPAIEVLKSFDLVDKTLSGIYEDSIIEVTISNNSLIISKASKNATKHSWICRYNGETEVNISG